MISLFIGPVGRRAMKRLKEKITAAETRFATANQIRHNQHDREMAALSLKLDADIETMLGDAVSGVFKETA